MKKATRNRMAWAYLDLCTKAKEAAQSGQPLMAKFWGALASALHRRIWG